MASHQPGPSRARSEPPATTADVEMVFVKRSQSHWDFARIPQATYHCPTLEEVSESQEISQLRSVSPAPTEIDDPEPDYVEEKLHKIGAKIRDFAYEKTTLKQIPELFDQYDAIAEFEYRLAQRPRVYPIQGKTLRRLLIIGWVDQEEVDERCDEMDMEELRKADSRPHWPFTLKFRRSECSKRPTADERVFLTQSRHYGYMRLDRLRRTADLCEWRKEQDSQEAQLAMASIREREAASALKRPYGEGEGTPEQKRRRRDEDEFDSDSQMLMPSKQYPAALFSYDPQIYPEAAGVIESQSQGQPLAMDLAPPPRIDTPPLEEEDTRPNALRRPVRGLKRTLSRTQTFSEL